MFILFSTFIFYILRLYQDFSLHFNERKVQLNAQLNKIQWDVDRIQLFAAAVALSYYFCWFSFYAVKQQQQQHTLNDNNRNWFKMDIFSACVDALHRFTWLLYTIVCTVRWIPIEFEYYWNTALVSIDSIWIESNRIDRAIRNVRSQNYIYK